MTEYKIVESPNPYAFAIELQKCFDNGWAPYRNITYGNNVWMCIVQKVSNES